MARHRSSRSLSRRRKHTTRRRRSGCFWPAVAAILVVLAAAYAAGRWLGSLPGRGAASYAPDQPEAPRYLGTAPFVVAVDAGHGGGDVGAMGLVEEYQMTWDTAQALLALLEADPNFIPVATRSSIDESADPADRAAAANAAGAQLLLSIHGNAADSPDPAGFECYPVPPGRTRHSQSAAFGRMLSQAFAAAGHTLRGANGIRYAYYDGQTKLLTEPGGRLYDPLPTFGVLEHAACPALLAEQCFVTSEADVAAFGSGAGIDAAARCYYNAICAYFDCEPLPAE